METIFSVHLIIQMEKTKPSGKVKSSSPSKKSKLRFTDFCAGIGGGRQGLENLGLECVGFSEIDEHAEIMVI
jgi:hypothetical protein